MIYDSEVHAVSMLTGTDTLTGTYGVPVSTGQLAHLHAIRDRFPRSFGNGRFPG
jgi:hypothetical protein